MNSERPDLAQRLCALLVAQDKRLDSLPAPTDSWCIDHDPHTRRLLPLVFLHIPKTAGSVIRLLLQSLFDRNELAPLFNFDDYGRPERIGSAIAGGCRLFMGHMYIEAVSAIETALDSVVRKVTFLRDPVSHVVSQVAFSNQLYEAGVRTVEFGDGQAPLVRRDLSNIEGLPVNGQTCLLCGREEWQRGAPTERIAFACDQLTDMSVFGLFEDMRSSLDLFSHALRLPYLEVPEMQLNASGADHRLPAELAREIARRSDHDQRLSEFSRAEFARRFDAAFGNPAPSPEARHAQLDAAYRDAVFAALDPHWTVELSADRSWPGTGWGLRDWNVHEQVWRATGPSGRATILARLRPQSGYMVRLRIHSAPLEAMEGLYVTANEKPLAVAGLDIVGGSPVLNWVMPANSIAPDGAVEIAFMHPPARGALQVAAIQVCPLTAQYLRRKERVAKLRNAWALLLTRTRAASPRGKRPRAALKLASASERL